MLWQAVRRNSSKVISGRLCTVQSGGAAVDAMGEAVGRAAAIRRPFLIDEYGPHLDRGVRAAAFTNGLHRQSSGVVQPVAMECERVVSTTRAGRGYFFWHEY